MGSMMSKTDFTVDFTDFDKKFKNIIQRAAPESTRIGIREAAQEWKLDADNVPPKTPHLEGHLRASGEVSEAEIKGEEISAEVTYGGVKYKVPYAKRWHEAEPGTVKWSEPGVGPKYLESKAVMFMKKYMNIIAEIIKRRAK